VRGGTGLLLGKFMPPHRGHQFLIEFARQYVERLTVMVCSLPGDPIPGHLRHGWVSRMFPDARVVHVTDDLPQEPADHPNFWILWRDACRAAAGADGVDYVFASEPYGLKLAEVLGARFVPVDTARELVPVSGTAVRADPMRHWEMIPECVRPYFVKRVCVFGPESTGKSTLARDLARAFGTVYAFEYARPHLDPQGGRCTSDDIPRIVRGQVATEEALAHQANRVLFCDTDVLTTCVWGDVLFGHTPQWVRDLAERRGYDLYLVTDVDVPWVSDGQRFFSEQAQRRAMFERFLGELVSRGRPYRVIRGAWEQRLRDATGAVRALLESPPGAARKS
jgi:HTH-type transcriptional regulator, transcriptional repressor of NAD biosynthesis genes